MTFAANNCWIKSYRCRFVSILSKHKGWIDSNSTVISNRKNKSSIASRLNLMETEWNISWKTFLNVILTKKFRFSEMIVLKFLVTFIVVESQNCFSCNDAVSCQEPDRTDDHNNFCYFFNIIENLIFITM